MQNIQSIYSNGEGDSELESAYSRKQRGTRMLGGGSPKMSGRWTKEEHKSFLEALKLYGKN